ncbi:unnamed protein product [Paramecium octaurelia]|uniref:Uncharacterized protein n=1 Tax=Paramecium octaurelia TaxID=43137 RepID=A0A8S1W8M3_PAROT|nr:unnamed protein product [Paramecium octaurelia]
MIMQFRKTLRILNITMKKLLTLNYSFQAINLNILKYFDNKYANQIYLKKHWSFMIRQL